MLNYSLPSTSEIRIHILFLHSKTKGGKRFGQPKKAYSFIYVAHMSCRTFFINGECYDIYRSLYLYLVNMSNYMS